MNGSHGSKMESMICLCQTEGSNVPAALYRRVDKKIREGGEERGGDGCYTATYRIHALIYIFACLYIH
jgi:hypothetical protein